VSDFESKKKKITIALAVVAVLAGAVIYMNFFGGEPEKAAEPTAAEKRAAEIEAQRAAAEAQAPAQPAVPDLPKESRPSKGATNAR